MNIFTSLAGIIKREAEVLQNAHRNTIIRWASRLTMIFFCCSFLVILLSWNKLPSEVPLWYSKPWGQSRLADPLWLFLLPGASIFWYIINSLISIYISKNHLVFSQILYLSALLGSVFSFVTVFMIIWIIS